MNLQKDTAIKRSRIKKSRLQVKLTDDLFEVVKKKAAAHHMTVSELIRQSLLRSTIVIKQIAAPHNSKELLMMKSAYDKFGAQLNMIAKHCNTYKVNSDGVKIMTALIQVERSIQDLRGQLSEVSDGDARIQ